MNKAVKLIHAGGEFDFYVPAAYARDTLFVSFIGYAAYQATVKAAQADTVFGLTAKPTQLNEIVVREQRLTAKEIVQRAIARIGENYPVEPYLLEGFFRNWQTNEMPDDYVRQYGAKHTGSLLEAAVTVYDEGYATKQERNACRKKCTSTKSAGRNYHPVNGRITTG